MVGHDPLEASLEKGGEVRGMPFDDPPNDGRGGGGGGGGGDSSSEFPVVMGVAGGGEENAPNELLMEDGGGRAGEGIGGFVRTVRFIGGGGGGGGGGCKTVAFMNTLLFVGGGRGVGKEREGHETLIDVPETLGSEGGEEDMPLIEVPENVDGGSGGQGEGGGDSGTILMLVRSVGEGIRGVNFSLQSGFDEYGGDGGGLEKREDT